MLSGVQVTGLWLGGPGRRQSFTAKAAAAIEAVIARNEAGGGWGDYLRRKHFRPLHSSVPDDADSTEAISSVEDLQASLAAAQDTLDKRKEIRTIERKARALTEEIRRLWDEQDRIVAGIIQRDAARQADISDSDLMLILALA